MCEVASFKNFENSLTTVKVMTKTKVAPFYLGHGVERINGIYNTPDTGCLECYRPHASVNTTTPKIDRKHMDCRNMLEILCTVKIVNKRLRNLLNEIQNVFINGKQVKTSKITQNIP